MSAARFPRLCFAPGSAPVSVLLAVLSVPLLSACGEPEDTRPGQPVAHRRAAFKEIVKTFEPMGVMLRTDKYNAKEFQRLAAQLQQQGTAPWDYFGPDTQYPPSHAKDAVWQAPEKFARHKEAFLKASQQLAKQSSDGADRATLEKIYQTLHDTCRDCHKDFKSR